MVRRKKWTYETCRKEAKKYKTRSNFAAGSSEAYLAAWKNKWLDKICKHIKEVTKPKNYWNYEESDNA